MNVYEKISVKAREYVADFGITDDPEARAENDQLFLVKSVSRVEDALKGEIERTLRENDAEESIDWSGVWSDDASFDFLYSGMMDGFIGGDGGDIAAFLDKNCIEWE